MDIPSLINSLLTPSVIAMVGIGVTAFLNSQLVKDLVSSASSKLDAEASALEVDVLNSKNIFVHDLVSGAMAFAEEHEADVLKAFASKADFVEKTVLSDPRFASLGVPADAIKLMIEQIFQSLYKTVDSGKPPAA